MTGLGGEERRGGGHKESGVARENSKAIGGGENPLHLDTLRYIDGSDAPPLMLPIDELNTPAPITVRSVFRLR